MSDTPISKGAGIIPDFFHDIIAYVIPGYVMMILILMNIGIASNWERNYIGSIDFATISLSLISAYIIGRFFEQLGKITIHNRKFPFFGKRFKIKSPKWTLLFDSKDKNYSEEFKDRVIEKMKEWSQKSLGDSFIEKCKDEGRDDYFNLLQYYLRERFPAVALYEKKQNSNIVLTRSLALIFFINIPIYFVILMIHTRFDSWIFSGNALLVLLLSASFSLVCYSRFKTDQKYLAMYIIENFMALKKLLRKSTDSSSKNASS